MKHNIILVGTPQRTDKKGFQAVRLRVSFNCHTTFIPTSIKWHKDFILGGQLLQGNETLKKYSEALKAMNELKTLISNKLENEFIETPNDLKEAISNKSKLEFIQYAKNKLRERLQKTEIEHSTYRVQLESISSFQKFRNKVPFTSIDLVLIENFKTWLKLEGLKRNTIWTRLKDIRTYMNQAIKDGINFNYPFGSAFKMPKAQSRIEYLSESEFEELKKYYLETSNGLHRETLRAFLFSCYSGLRISDIKAIKGKCLKNNKLIFEPLKTKNSESKKFIEIEIPLHPFASELLPTKIFNELPIFKDLPAQQKMNSRLKEIATALNINSFSFHYSRHTFATRFLRYGGKIEVLQKLLGHESLQTTMIYIHIEPSHAENQINLIP